MVDALESGTVAEAKPSGNPVFQMAPTEDSGSDTLGRYRYQAEVAARDCLAMMTQDNIDYVVCEWHEDFIVAFTDGSVELVSVKHREYDQGPWSVTDLCKAGGLAHLFDRWCACNQAPNVRLRLATNAALKPGNGNAATMARMCGPQPEISAGFDGMALTIARNFIKIRWNQPYVNIPETPKVKKLEDITLPEGFLGKIKTFMKVLEINNGLPDRQYITDVNIQQILSPAFVNLQITNVHMEATYKAVLERIERANRDEGDRGQLAILIADPTRVRYSKQLQERVGRRRISRETILGEVVYTTARIPTYRRGQVPVLAPGGSKLRKKLSRGEVPSDEAQFAEELRSAWYITWSERRSGLVGDAADLTNLSLEILAIVFNCRSHAQREIQEGDVFGSRMNRLISDKLIISELPEPPPFNINDMHLQGLAYQLCDDCRFYFSAPFDLESDAS